MEVTTILKVIIIIIMLLIVARLSVTIYNSTTNPVEGFRAGGYYGRNWYRSGWSRPGWYWPFYSPLSYDWYYPYYYNRPLWNRYAWAY